MPTNRFDFGIAGAGLAGILTADALTRTYPGAKIVLVDADFSLRNDRTWCYWTDNKSPFPELVSKKWNAIAIRNNQNIVRNKPGAFRYEMISERDFRASFFEKLQQSENITWIESGIESVIPHAVQAEIRTKSGVFTADKVFQSVQKAQYDRQGNYPLLQHFLGWEIATATDVFDPDEVLLMDFDVDQKDGFAFVYVLPFSAREALIECTYFSRNVLPDESYERILETWIFDRHRLRKPDFQISRIEKGVIPMNDNRQVSFPAGSLVDIGTPAGFVKPSTGYAFKRTVDRIAQLESYLRNEPVPESLKSSSLYHYFDRLMLHVLDSYPRQGPAIFFNLFKKRGLESIFTFLDERSTKTDLLKIMLSVPSLPFLRGMVTTSLRRS